MSLFFSVLSLVFCSDGGPAVLHVLLSSIAFWYDAGDGDGDTFCDGDDGDDDGDDDDDRPSLLFCLLALLASYCHGTNYLIKVIKCKP